MEVRVVSRLSVASVVAQDGFVAAGGGLGETKKTTADTSPGKRSTLTKLFGWLKPSHRGNEARKEKDDGDQGAHSEAVGREEDNDRLKGRVPVAEEAIAAKADSALKIGAGGGEVGASVTPFALLPLETLCELVTFLDYQTLLALRQTCAWAYGLVLHQKAGLTTKLAQHVVRIHPATDASAQTAELTAGEQALRALFVHALRSAERVPSATVSELQKLLDPKMTKETSGPGITGGYSSADDEGGGDDEGRMVACMSVRVFGVPKGLTLFGEELPQLAAGGLAKLETKIKVYEDDFEGDAWTETGDFSLGPEMVPIASADHLKDVLRGHRRFLLYGDTFAKVRVPEVQHALQAFGALVCSHEIMLWRDAQYKGRGHGGHRLVILGGRCGAVVQWEYHSNFCGGPYANYDCGMG